MLTCLRFVQNSHEEAKGKFQSLLNNRTTPSEWIDLTIAVINKFRYD